MRAPSLFSSSCLATPLLLTLACSGEPAPEETAPEAEPPEAAPPEAPRLAAAPLRFTPLEASLSEEVRVTHAATLGGEPRAVAWNVVGQVGEEGMGRLLDARGEPLDALRKPFTDFCNEADFNALLQPEGALWWVTHFECTRGALAQALITQRDDGQLVREGPWVLQRALDHQDGIYDPCAGQVTPWGTHLASEEYEPDARGWDPEACTIGDTRWWDAHMPRAFCEVGVQTHPYRFGWIPELYVGADSKVAGGKHLAMGRFSHELAHVLPDERTVYLSDDGSLGVGWFMFVADQPRQLDAGTLYAARWDAGSGALTWLSLGHATNDELEPFVFGESPVQFADLFSATEMAEDGTCAAGTPVFANGKGECLAFAQPGAVLTSPELVRQVASRLETRRTAAILGATVELEKAEGVAYDPEGRTVYLALSSAKKSMLAGNPAAPGLSEEERARVDHVGVGENACGGIYAGGVAGAVSDMQGDPIASDLVMTTLAPVEGLMGVPLAEPDAEGNTCAVDAIANPDNIAFAPGHDTLFVAEDTHAHARNVLWAWHPSQGGAPTRVLSAPPLAEVTGIQWYEVGAYAYLTASIQHPWVGDEELVPYGPEVAKKASFVGYLGPFSLE